MKKLFFIVPLVFLLSQVFAIDFGGIIEDTFSDYSTLDGSTDAFVNGMANDTKATAWVNTPFDINNKSYLSAEGFYNLNWAKANTDVTNTVDLSLLKLSMIIDLSNTISTKFDIGRYIVSDATGSILSQTIDGALVTLNFPSFVVSAMGGYTGLLNAKTTSFTSKSTETVDTSKVYVLAQPFVLASLNVSFPYVFANITPTVEYLAAIDTKNGYQRMYTTAMINGPLTSIIYYTVSSSLGLTKTDADSSFGISNLSKVNLSAYPNFLSSSFGINAAFATGGTSNNSAFQTFTTGSASLAGHSWSNLLKGGASASIKPLSCLLISLNADAFCTLKNTASDDSFTYDGFQFQPAISWQILSDVQLVCSGGMYIPKDGSNIVQCSVKAAISF